MLTLSGMQDGQLLWLMWFILCRETIETDGQEPQNSSYQSLKVETVMCKGY